MMKISKEERIKKGLLHCCVDGCDYDGGMYTSYRIEKGVYTGYFCPEHERKPCSKGERNT